MTAALLLLAAATDWSYLRSGPLELWFQGDDKPARAALATFDQVRHWTGKILGRDEVTPLWPVRIVIAGRPAGHRLNAIVQRRDGYVIGLAAKAPVPPSLVGEFVATLLRDDVKAMRPDVERGIVDVLSTAEVTASRILLGKPPANKTRDWARVYMLIVDPEYAGRSRVFFSNLQQGVPIDIAYRNSFERTEKEMEALVDARWSAGQFEPQTVSGKPLNPDRDYRERPGDSARANVLLADLLEGEAARKAYLAVINESKSSEAMEGAGMFAEATAASTESASAWLAYAKEEKDLAKARAALQKAMQLNPRWAEPHLQWAARETESIRKVAPLKKAVELNPRDSKQWIALAEVLVDAKDFSGANESWRWAERSAPSEEVRSQIAQRRAAYEQQRADLEAAERRRQEEEKQRELERLRNEALAEVRRAEAKANAKDAPADPNRKVLDWWDGPKAAQTVTGTLERIDCLRNGPAKWIVKEGAKLHAFAVPDPSKVAILGAGELTFGCGPQRPARKVKVEAGAKGELLTVEFQ